MAKTVEQVELRVGNLDCEHDAAAIERGLAGFSGLQELKIYPSAAKVILSYDPAQTSDDELKAKLGSLGFPIQVGRELAKSPAPWRNPKVLSSVVAGILLGVGWLLSVAGIPDPLPLGIYIVSMLIGGYFFGREGLEELLFEREIGIEILMLTAAVTATALGHASEGAMLVFLYSLSEAAEGYTEDKTRSAIRALMDLTPKVALVKRDGQEVEIPVEQLVVGDIFIVRPGQSLATDGQVVAGTSSVNQAPVTGESVPVEKEPGETVFAGSINGQGALEIRATKTYADNTIARIIQMVEEAQEQKGKSQRFIERFGARYSPAVLAAGILLAVVPPLLFGGDWGTWLTRATVFIVAAAPCALVISVPITLVASLGTGARNGVLIKGGIYLEELAKVKAVAFDKTGTLTEGQPVVTDVLPLTDRSNGQAPSVKELMAIAAGIERRSEHPLARAMVQYAAEQDLEPVETDSFQALTGAGAQAKLQGQMIYIGAPSFFTTQLRLSIADIQEDVDRLQAEGKTVVLLGSNQGIWAVIALQDTVRPNAKAALAALRGVGVTHLVMLTGDNERTAQAIAKQLGIDEVYAELKPEDKVAKVRELEQRYGQVAMIGDGVNDAPALAEASIGVAMGAAGTDVALETADVALMADDLEKLVYALQLAKRNQSVVRQNLALSAVVISVLVVGAVGGFFTLPIAVLGHEISEFIVIGSGLRMLRS